MKNIGLFVYSVSVDFLGRYDLKYVIKYRLDEPGEKEEYGITKRMNECLNYDKENKAVRLLANNLIWFPVYR